MPATVTHHIFAKDVFKVINTNIQNKLQDSKGIFNLFGQGFDILFFSNSKLGHKAHNYNSNLYFHNIIKYIIDNNLYNNSQVLAYLYGSICHYVLDSTVHPYVFYYTGRVVLNDKSTYKYRGLHSYFEYMIDAILYEEKYHKELYKVNITKEVFSKIKFSKELNKMIDYVYLDSFNYHNGAADVNRGRKNFKFIMKHGMCSRFGIKKLLFKCFDALHIVKNSKYSNCSFYIKKLDNSVLNLNHEKWYYPVDKKISYHYSFYDLYDVAIERAKNLINNIDNAIDKDEKQINKVIREIGNLSYTTGKSINKRDVMKYFKF